MVAEIAEQVLAHPHEGGGAAGGKVEAPDQFLPARLGGGMQILQRAGRVVALERGNRLLGAAAVRPEAVRQRGEEFEPARFVGGRIAGQQRLREGDARGLAASRQELFAEIGQRAPHRMARLALAEQGSAPLGERVDEVAQEGWSGLQSRHCDSRHGTGQFQASPPQILPAKERRHRTTNRNQTTIGMISVMPAP